MVMRDLGEVGFALGCSGASESACAGAAGASPYSSMVMLSAEADRCEIRLSSLWVVVCSWCVDCVSWDTVVSDTVCLVVWQAQSSTTPISIRVLQIVLIGQRTH